MALGTLLIIFMYLSPKCLVSGSLSYKTINLSTLIAELVYYFTTNCANADCSTAMKMLNKKSTSKILFKSKLTDQTYE